MRGLKSESEGEKCDKVDASRCISFKAFGKDDEYVLNALTVLRSLLICVEAVVEASVRSVTGVLGTGESKSGRSEYVEVETETDR